VLAVGWIINVQSGGIINMQSGEIINGQSGKIINAESGGIINSQSGRVTEKGERERENGGGSVYSEKLELRKWGSTVQLLTALSQRVVSGLLRSIQSRIELPRNTTTNKLLLLIMTN